MIYLRKMGAARVADLVEKDAEGLPIAFRIWQFGENLNAEGEPDLFDKESAALLLRQQEEIGRDFSFDYNHAMFQSVDPDECISAGFHRIEVRGDGSNPADGCWLVNCQWTEKAKGFLLQDPPEYRYTSPTFEADAEGRIVRYFNCALTNIPATYGIPSLRSETPNKETTMTREELLAALAGFGVDTSALESLSDDELKAALAGGAAPASSPDVTQAAEDAPEAAPAEERACEPEEPTARATRRAVVAPLAARAQGAPLQRATATAPRNTRPATSRDTHVLRSRGIKLCDIPRMRRNMGLPPVPTEVSELPPHVGIDAFGNLVILRNSADRRKLEKETDQIHAVRARHGNG